MQSPQLERLTKKELPFGNDPVTWGALTYKNLNVDPLPTERFVPQP
jgi:hypothetical protein